jgi:hypothetical protein
MGRMGRIIASHIVALAEALSPSAIRCLVGEGLVRDWVLDRRHMAVPALVVASERHGVELRTGERLRGLTVVVVSKADLDSQRYGRLLRRGLPTVVMSTFSANAV